MSSLTFHKTSTDREKILRLFDYTKSARRRMRQRGIWCHDVRQTICHGREFYHDGLLIFALDFESIPNGRDHILIDELEGIVVVLDSATYKVITVYRNPNAIPKIERMIRYWCWSRKGRKVGVRGVTHH